MEILEYIRDLLILNDCITIPRFGGFVSIYHPAKIKASTFSPPSKSVSFNRKLNYDDGLLTSYIARKNAISYRAAAKKVSQLVAEINYRLTDGESISFPGVGTLVYDEHENLLFKSQGSNNLNPDCFGLFSFSHDKYLIEPFVNKPKVNLNAAIRNRKFHRAIIVVPLLALLTAIPLVGPKDNISKSSISNLREIAVPEPIIEAAPDVFVAEPEVTIENHAVTLSENLIPEVSVVDKYDAKAYYLVIGCFKQKENAELQVSQMKKKGYPAKLIGFINGLHYVAADNYPSKEKASAGLKDYYLKEPKSGAWIYHK